ncbi:hypothetical protein [Paraburkholderia sp. HD33-4]|uniref:hypothetical protein n=1 Tax=Paraburkholderia sp. HD33-4 TaxID=2883242 RepID=UPI001F3259C7|nr:hypothetical protein [Paraburkholderia sp. HD33-4]
MPEGELIYLVGKITVGQDKYASGHYTQIDLLNTEISPCTGKPVRQMLLWNMNVGDPMILAKYVDQVVVVGGTINCPVAGIQFSPDPQRVVPVY